MGASRPRHTRVVSSKWNDEWYLAQHVQVRNLFDYLSECAENNAAGVYQCDRAVARLKTANPPWRVAAYEAAWGQCLPGHVNAYEHNWIWVVNYFKWNTLDQGGLSPLQAKGIMTLLGMAPTELQRDFWLRYGRALLAAGMAWQTLGNGLADPCETLGNLPPLPGPSLTGPDHTKEGGAVAPRKRAAPPTTSADAAPRATWPAERAALQAIPGYPFDESKDRLLMDSLAEAYSQLDLAAQLREMKTWLAARDRLPLRGQAGPRSQVRNWMRKGDEFAASRGGRSGEARGDSAIRRTTAGPREKNWHER